jgi:hypothetical protein
VSAGGAATTGSGTGGSGASTSTTGTGGAPAVMIPEASDFTDHGVIFTEGVPGEWDRYLWGGFAGTAVKKNGTYHLYYQGASDYLDDPYYTVIYRAIGVATSSDGITFTKHAGNPILEWLPNNGIEEGAVSAGSFLGPNDEVMMYYGANTEISASLINADARLAVSSNAIDFEDTGLALDHGDASTWGSGDELFPVIGFHHAGSWYAYYIPNGSPEKGQSLVGMRSS